MPTIKIPKKLKIKSLYPPNKPIRKISGAQVENNVPDADYDHATALYKDQWKDRKIADYDKEHDKEKRAKEMRADAGEDRKRMYAMTKDKWKHAKYATGEEEGKKSVTGNTPDPKDTYKEEVSPLVAVTVNELSKKTLGRYVKAAGHSAVDHAMALQRTSDKNQTPKDVEKHAGKVVRRGAGISKAVDKLSKEEVSPLIDAAATVIGRLERESFSGTPNMTHDPKFGQSIATKYDPTLGELSQLSKTLKKLHNEYVPEEVVEITSIDDLAGLDHHDFGFETRADMVEFAWNQIEDMGRSVKKPAVSQSEIDAFLAKGGKIKKIKSKGIPKYAQAAHQKMGPASAHRMYKPGSGKSEEVE